MYSKEQLNSMIAGIKNNIAVAKAFLKTTPNHAKAQDVESILREQQKMLGKYQQQLEKDS